ncbi:MAG TPA: serine protease [Cyclobacteriaceae bacterium]|jgi:hypothetical protein|nr:serine protease [Cyclobacteriaceae bacterium]
MIKISILIFSLISWGLFAQDPVYEKAKSLKNNVVLIKGRTSGFGFIAAVQEGYAYIITARHVVVSKETPDTLKVIWCNKNLQPVKVTSGVLSNPTYDVAIFRVKAPVDLDWNPKCYSDVINQNMPVSFIGKNEDWYVPTSVNTGAIFNEPSPDNRIKFEMRTMPGTSGAPLINQYGINGLIVDGGTDGTGDFGIAINMTMIKYLVETEWRLPFQIQGVKVQQTNDAAYHGELPQSTKVGYGGPPYCYYYMRYHNVDVNLVFDNTGQQVLSSDASFIVEETASEGCPYQTASPNTQRFTMENFKIRGDSVLISYSGDRGNNPASDLTLKGRIEKDRIIASLFSKRINMPDLSLVYRIRMDFQLEPKKGDGISPPMNNKEKIDIIDERNLERAKNASKIGSGDNELKAFSTTHLTGNFELLLQNGRTKLIGELNADIKEEARDQTAFRIKKIYEIYGAPQGYRINRFEIEDAIETKIELDFYQKSWHTTESFTRGPLIQMAWQGDSGKEDDRIDGCWIEPKLRKIKVYLERE